MSEEKSTLAIILFSVAFSMFMAAGWVINLLAIVHAATSMHSLQEVTPLLVLRTVGLFLAPLGAILGWVA